MKSQHAEPRLPQSMQAREALSADWLEAVRHARGERDRVTVEFGEGGAAPTPREYRLFFVTGHPRSGTHWLGSLLNLHPAIYTDGEFFFDALHEGFGRLSAWKWLAVGGDAGHAALRDACFEDSVRRLLVAVAPRKAGATHIADRTPRLLKVLLPGAAHIVALRDGRDVLVSWTFHQLRVGGRMLERFCDGARGGQRPRGAGMRAVRDAFAADPDAFEHQPGLLLSDERWVRAVARQWAEHVRHDAAAAAAMDAGTIDARALVVRYEDVHADPSGQAARMAGFLGLDPALMAPVSDDSGTAPGGLGRDPRSFFRSGRVGDWQRYFTPEAGRWFEEEAGETLREAGYETAPDWQGDCRVEG
ncbi:MAG: sulfotransferase [Phycisphaerales bacterium]